MAVAKKTASKTTTTTIVPWSERFAKHAQAAKEQEKGVGGFGQRVKFGPGVMTVAGGSLPGGKLECVVIGSCAANALYEGAYDPDAPETPVCYAFNVLTEDMAPHEDAPQKQAGNCAECEQNQFGSAATGRGKACANTRLLGLLTSKDCEDAAAISTVELAVARISPTNLKAWAGYVRAVADEHGRPPWGVVTEISSHPDPKTQIRLEFRMVELIDDGDTLEALEKRAGDKVQEVLQQPYTALPERPAKPAKAVKPAIKGVKTTVAKSSKFAVKR
jgi:hypothetical protein